MMACLGIRCFLVCLRTMDIAVCGCLWLHKFRGRNGSYHRFGVVATGYCMPCDLCSSSGHFYSPQVQSCLSC
jgi:hypothetical protein